MFTCHSAWQWVCRPLTYDDEPRDESQDQQLRSRGDPHCEVVHGTQRALQDHRDLARQLKSMAWADVGALSCLYRDAVNNWNPLSGHCLHVPNILRYWKHVLSLSVLSKGTHTPSESF